MRTSKGYYSELNIARESATITWALAETQRQAEKWENFMVDLRKWLQACLAWRLLTWGRHRRAKQGTLIG